MLARIPAKAAPELEIKFQLGAGAREALERELFPPGTAQVSQLHATYFDTPTHRMRDGGFSLRVRRNGDHYVQTLKHNQGGGLFQRQEWETPVAGPELDLAALKGTPAEAAAGDAALEPAFTVEVERRVHVWTHGRTRIEVSLDAGVITAGDRHEVVAELELELVSGSAKALFALAHQLQDKAALTLLFESKAARGYRLAGHDGVAALKAQQTAVGPATTGAEAFQLIAREALVQVAGNARLLQRSHSPEVLHQARVGLRRLRAALSAFRQMLDAEGLNHARAETKWLAGELSEARDLDVFLHRTGGADEVEDDPRRAAFLRALRLAQAEAYDKALAAVGSARFRALLLRLADWIEAGAWKRLAGDEPRRLREGPVSALAGAMMDRLDRRLRKRSRKFMGIDAQARHDLRKQAKKLRYAAAFFGGAFPKHPKRRERFVAALRTLQDRLGEINDMTVARTVAMRAVDGRSREVAFAAGLEVGRLTTDEAQALDAANAAFKAFRKAPRFWESPDRRNDDIKVSPPRLRSV
ncbi:MAG: CHAD domain-containing protein [Caulobacterales bacterium]|nr:CHAD domain-containing protein [Caulobacterales bacterium]